MVIVSNTSPISNLAAIGQLDLIRQLYGVIRIPNAVYEELLDERAGETVITAVLSATWLEVWTVQNQALVSQLRDRVNIGEAEAIALAVELHASRLLIDERLGRQAAIEEGVVVTGVLGVLLAAKRRGLIPAVKPQMDHLITQAGFRIGSQLYADIVLAACE